MRLRVTVVLNLPTDSNTTSRSKNVHSSSEVYAANVLEVHVDTVWSGFLQSSNQIIFAIQSFVVDGVVEAKLFLNQLCFLRTTTGTDHLAIVECLCKLANKTTDCTGCGTDEDCFTFEGTKSFNKTAVYGSSGHSKYANTIRYLALSDVVCQFPKKRLLQLLGSHDLESAEGQIGAKKIASYPTFFMGHKDFSRNKAEHWLASFD